VPVITRGNNAGAWATPEGKDFLAYLQLVEGDGRADISRVANKPNRYLNKEALEDLKLGCAPPEVTGKPRLEAMIRYLLSHPKKGAAELGILHGELEELPWEKRCAKIGQVLGKDAKQRAKEDAALDDLAQEMEEDDKGEVYAALAKAAAGFGSYEALQARGKKHIRPGVPAPAPVVEISTVHRYKGDEADTTIVAGACLDHMPHKKNKGSEEEVRIWYVAVTRARKKLIISTGGHPSPFLVSSGLIAGGRQ
jgi:superfamily I DNA/RNA helicase